MTKLLVNLWCDNPAMLIERGCDNLTLWIDNIGHPQVFPPVSIVRPQASLRYHDGYRGPIDEEIGERTKEDTGCTMSVA